MKWNCTVWYKSTRILEETANSTFRHKLFWSPGTYLPNYTVPHPKIQQSYKSDYHTDNITCSSLIHNALLTFSHSHTLSLTHSFANMCMHTQHILKTLVPSSLYLLQTCWFTHVQQLYQPGIHQTECSRPLYSLSKTSFHFHLDISSRRN